MASELDVQSVLDAAIAGKTLEQCTVYRARKSYFYGEAFFSLALAAILAMVPGVVIVIFVVSSSEPQPPGGESPVAGFGLGTGLLLVAGLAVLALAVAFAGRAVLLVRSSRSADTQLLVLMPSGFVARTPDKVISVRYTDVAAISMHVTHSKYDTFIRLHMTFRNARGNSGLGYMDWQVDPRFGPKDEIAQAIIAGHARFQASQ